MLKKVPHTYTIISVFIIFCAILTWIVPAGEYARTTIEVNGVQRNVIESDSFHSVESSPQTWQIFESLYFGFQQQAGIIVFLLIMGGAFQIVNHSKSIDIGIFSFLHSARKLEKYAIIKKIGIDNVVIASVILLFSLFGSIFGMSEETIAFVIILVPLSISMGYDSLVGICMVYVAAHVGFSGATLNPFTVGLAQGLSDLPLYSGLEYRFICWAILTLLLIIFVLLYARKIKKNPRLSPMYAADEYWRKRELEAENDVIHYNTPRSAYIVYGLIVLSLVLFSFHYPVSHFSIGEQSIQFYIIPLLSVLFSITGYIGLRKSAHFFILTILGFTILFLISGVLCYSWYLSEISALFLSMGILAGYAYGNNADGVIKQFIAGAKDMLSAGIVVGLASGIVRILQDGRIIDTILHSLANLMDGAGKLFSLGMMYLVQTVINFFIPSGSVKAALTMPIMAPFSDLIGLSRQAMVMAYQFGDGFTNMIIPTSAVLIGALGVARVPYEVWVKWFYKVVLFFVIVGFLLLIPMAN